MSFFDSEFSNEEEYDLPFKNLDSEFESCKKILESGYIYDSVERIEDIIQVFIENERYDDSLF
jgi:hypothetical protein